MRGWPAAILVAVSAAACGGSAGGESAAPATTTPPDTVAATPPAEGTTGPVDSDVPTPSATGTPVTATEATTPSSQAGRADGVLTIGTLLPDTGPGNDIGIAAINAVNVGVREINERGGVLGEPVRWVNASEGETLEDARSGIEYLLDNNVDAIIGPASSITTLNVLGELMDAGVLVCSPTATALALNDYPNRELFFRTVPSDSLSAQAMAVMAVNTGVESYGVIYLDDQFGRPFAREAIRRLDGPEVVQLDEWAFPPGATSEELAEIATDIAEAAPRTILLVADSANGWPMMQALASVFTTEPPTIIINDAMRRPPNRELVAGLPPEFRDRIQGVSPVVPPGRNEPVGPYATNALDCLNLIALAALEAESDDPLEIAEEMVGTSIVGALCHSFAECRNHAEDNLNLNYQGPNSIDFSPRGDPARGRLGVFVFDQSGLDVPTGRMEITERLDE